MAGEFGHVLVAGDGEVCRCGNRGCLETAASTTALLELLRRSHGEITVAQMIEMAKGGDLRARRVIADAGRVVGIAAAGLLNVLNPQRLVIGGDLAPAGDLLLDEVREALRRTALPTAADQATVVAGELGERAEVLGALAGVVGASAQNRTFHTPTHPGGGFA
jgi:predicted NBD/HSP70 family sugar kinase